MCLTAEPLSTNCGQKSFQASRGIPAHGWGNAAVQKARVEAKI